MSVVIRIFKTVDGAIHQVEEPEEGCWIALTNPTATEIFELSDVYKRQPFFLCPVIIWREEVKSLWVTGIPL